MEVFDILIRKSGWYKRILFQFHYQNVRGGKEIHQGNKEVPQR